MPLVAALLAAAPAAAQEVPADSAAAPPAAVVSPPADSGAAPPSDSVSRPPISPLGGLWRSMQVPGWGQARLNRRLTGALFVTWEGLTLGMSLKASHELHFLREIRSTRAASKKKEVQDWLVLLAFNHLFAGLEAYVSAHLWDFPGDLHLDPLPGGRMGAGVTVPLR